jgi:Polysaccharide deacetylase
MTLVSDFILTFDIDWAPDFIIDYVADILIRKKIKATWFVTHQSEAIERLRKSSDLFELGIHPNLLLGSTHGKTEDEVLTHMMNIVPNAVSMRTHGLYQSSHFLTNACMKYGIINDVSLFLPRASYLHPHILKLKGMSLRRIPYFWEDDSEMYEDIPIWNILDHRLNVSGLRIFDFHPIHIALNTEKFERYSNLKTIQPIKFWDEQFIKDYAYNGNGPKMLFLEIIEKLADKGTLIKHI